MFEGADSGCVGSKTKRIRYAIIFLVILGEVPPVAGQEDEGGGVDVARDDVGIDEDAGADDAAHDEHGGVEGTEAAGQRVGFRHSFESWPRPRSRSRGTRAIGS